MTQKAYPVFYRTAVVKDRKVFYREAGNPSSPTIVFLHGLPSSSSMFQDLISTLADKFHLVAPDLMGYGHSEAPSRDDFQYTFENLTAYVESLLEQLHINSFALYLHDIGGPVGFRIFHKKPEQVTGFIIQNANAYPEGIAETAKQLIHPLWENRTPETEEPAKSFLTAAYTQHLWTIGARDTERINPDHWLIDQALLDRPGLTAIQIDILENMKTNGPLYPTWQADFRAQQPTTLILWGKEDPVFIPPGAQGYLRDIPKAKLVWLEAGHFVLDENLHTVAAEITDMFGNK